METPKTTNQLFVLGYRTLTAVLLAAGVWLASQVWDSIKTGQTQTTQSISSLQQSVNDIKLSNAASDGTRFTIKDWDTKRETLDGRFAEHEKRIGAIESATKEISSALTRIESKLSKP